MYTIFVSFLLNIVRLIFCIVEKVDTSILPYILIPGFFQDFGVFSILALILLLFALPLKDKKEIILKTGMIFFCNLVLIFYIINIPIYHTLKVPLSFKLAHFLDEIKDLKGSIEEVVPIYVILAGIIIYAGLTYIILVFLKKLKIMIKLKLLVIILIFSIIVGFLSEKIYLPDKAHNKFYKRNIIVLMLRETRGEIRRIKFKLTEEDIKRVQDFINSEKDREFFSLEYPFLYKTTKRYNTSKNFNIVVIILESFRAKDIGVMGGKYNVTPFFDSLTKKGIFFTHFYSCGVQTAKALSSALGGSLIYHGDRETKYHPKTRYFGLGLLLNKLGYKDGLFMVGQDPIYDKMYTFFILNGFKRILGINSFPKNALRTSWGILDEIVFEKSIEEMDKLQKPFYFVILTLSNHHPYDIPKKDFFKYNNLGYYGRFLAGMNYTDYSLSLFFEKIKNRKYFKNSIFLIFADHGEAPLIESETTLLKQNLNEDNIRVPFLIYAPGLNLKPKRISYVGSHIDVLPTLCDLIGYYPRITHWPGKSLLNDKINPDKRWAFAQTSFGESFIAIMWKNYKLTYNFTKNEFVLYRVSPERVEEERINLDSIPQKELEYYKKVLISLYKVTNFAILKNRIFDMKYLYER